LLLFDPVRELSEFLCTYEPDHAKGGVKDQRTEIMKTTTFNNDVSSIKRFKNAIRKRLQLVKSGSIQGGSLEQTVREILLQFVLNDTLEVLAQTDDALDTIGESMASDDNVQNFVQNWRELLAKWNNGLTRQGKFIDYAIRAINEAHRRKSMSYQKSPAALIPGSQEDATTDENSAKYLLEFKYMREDVIKLGKRTESTFQALMSTMAIIESQRAIAQAKAVSKLTNLAFFFIPLTLSASVFGMNVIV
jgi:Mg2+ and Co2+ transporter CorA